MGVFGFFLKAQRKKVRLKQAQIAEKLDKALETIQNWENGRKSFSIEFSILLILILSEVLSEVIPCDIDDFIVDGKFDLKPVMERSLIYQEPSILQNKIYDRIAKYDQKFFNMKYAKTIESQLGRYGNLISRFKNRKKFAKRYVVAAEYAKVLKLTHEKFINYCQQYKATHFFNLTLLRGAESFALSLLWEIQPPELKSSLNILQNELGTEVTTQSKQPQITNFQYDEKHRKVVEQNRDRQDN